MAARGNRRVDPTRRNAGLPGWAILACGLAIGAIAVAGYDIVREKLTAPATTAAAPDAPTEPAAAKPKEKPKPRVNEAPPEKRYGFYDMLPNFEVVIPEVDGTARPDKTAAPITTPGVYVLQAGSYADQAEAVKVQARLTALGINSQLQKIAVDERQFHRVRIGPIETLPDLNRTRQRLRTAGIDAILIRVGE